MIFSDVKRWPRDDVSSSFERKRSNYDQKSTSATLRPKFPDTQVDGQVSKGPWRQPRCAYNFDVDALFDHAPRGVEAGRGRRPTARARRGDSSTGVEEVQPHGVRGPTPDATHRGSTRFLPLHATTCHAQQVPLPAGGQHVVALFVREPARWAISSFWKGAARRPRARPRFSSRVLAVRPNLVVSK